jgi:hypothetical protein
MPGNVVTQPGEYMGISQTQRYIFTDRHTLYKIG